MAIDDSAGLVSGCASSGRQRRAQVGRCSASNQRVVASALFTDGFPAWSPDGRRLALVSASSAASGGDLIFVMNADGSDKRRLTEGDSPVWSPDGRTIAFAREDSAYISDIYTISADGANQRRLTRSDPKLALHGSATPAWSPDGHKIAFASDRGISIMNADGSAQRLLTAGENDFSPSWSPDGRKIAFAGRSASSFFPQVYVMNADGSGVRQLTRRGLNASPSWSPDGQKIDFASNPKAKPKHSNGLSIYIPKTAIYLMNPDGTDRQRLTPPGEEAVSAAWSPDGRKIAFADHRVYLMDVRCRNDGSQ